MSKGEVHTQTCRCGRTYSPTDAPRKALYFGAYSTMRWGEDGYAATLCPTCFDAEGRRMEQAAYERDMGPAAGCPVCGRLSNCGCWYGRQLGEAAARSNGA